MWDCHFRVGGADGTDLGLADCPRGTKDYDKCTAAALLFHVTSTASGYFENVWVWTADQYAPPIPFPLPQLHCSSSHLLSSDNDQSTYWDPTAGPETIQISIFTGRGLLVESQGPCWFYGTGSEHSTMYQYQLYNAKDVSSRQ